MDSIAGPTGDPLVVQPWQHQLLGHVFARRRIDGRRRHRIAMVGMARKNGKTGLAAPIALYGLLAEGDGAQVFSCAADRDQAKLVFGAAKRMVELDEELSDRVKVYRDALEVRKTGSVYRALSSEAYTKEGLSPTLVVYDELHAAPDRDLYDVMALAQGARTDPLMLIVTTAGVRSDRTGTDSIAYSLYQHGKRVATGEVDDPTFFMAWWEPSNPSCAITDERAWAQANPGLDVILDREDLRAASHSGRMPESEFRIKRLNQWVNSRSAWLPTGAFEALETDRDITPKDRVVLGFDGSFNHDCTALVACTLDGHVEVLELWEKPDGAVDWEIPIDEVDAAVLGAFRDLNVIEIAADPYRWAREIQGWVGAGLPAVDYPTTSAARMVPACAKFYDAVVNGRLSHSGDPRLVRHVGNCVVKVDRLGPRIVKEHRGSPRSIDAAVAAVAAYDRATFHATQPAQPARTPAFLV